MIKRWDNPKDRMIAADEGNFVYYGDHVAEVERALAERDDWWTPAEHRKAVEAMRAACIAAVERLPVAVYSYRPDESLRDVGLWKSSVISALREVQP